MKKIKVRYYGEDFWGNKLYRNEENHQIYAKVDGRLHTITHEGEPIGPLKKEIEIEYIEGFDYEKIIDAIKLSKTEFLNSYSYCDGTDYNQLQKDAQKIIKQHEVANKRH